MIATRLEFVSIALLIPEQLVEAKREFRQVVTHLRQECNHSVFGL
jgi:hypothetical protein